MTIYDYIEKHKLKKIATWPNTQQHIHELLVDPRGDVFDIYRDARSTHFVSLNRTEGKFRIFHVELVPLFSDWFVIDQDYEQDTQQPAA